MANLDEQTRQKLVLLVAPVSFLRRNLAFLLQREGIDVVMASDGPEAFRLLETRRPALVILGADLAGSSGLTICEQIKRDPRFSSLPVVLFGSAAQAKFRQEAKAAGAYEVFSFPFDASDIICKVVNAMGGLPAVGELATVVPIGVGNPFRTEVAAILDDRRAMLTTPAPGDIPPRGFPRDTRAMVSFADGTYSVMQWEGVIKRVGPRGIEISLEKLVSREQRRQALRKPVPLQARYRLPNDFYRIAAVADLSVDGMRLSSLRGKVEQGMTIEFALNLPAGTLELKGQVRWLSQGHDSKCDIGVRFIDSDEAARGALLDYLFDGKTTVESPAAVVSGAAEAESLQSAAAEQLASAGTLLDQLVACFQAVSLSDRDSDALAVLGYLEQTLEAVDGLSQKARRLRHLVDSSMARLEHTC